MSLRCLSSWQSLGEWLSAGLNGAARCHPGRTSIIRSSESYRASIARWHWSCSSAH